MGRKVNVIHKGNDRVVLEFECACGCGLIGKTEIPKYINHQHYSVHLSKKNQARIKQESNLKMVDERYS